MVTTLAPAELLAEPELAELETTVREGTGAFMKVGVALMKIRDGKGYKLRGFKTFEKYCEQQFGITDRHGRRLIAATEASQAIEAAVGVAPASESVARELVNVAKDPVVLQKVKDKLEKKHTTLGSASAEIVRDVVAAVTGHPRAKPGSGRKPEAAHPAPKPNGKQPVAHPQPEPVVSAGDLGSLHAALTAARVFLKSRFKDDADVARIVGQLDKGLALLTRMQTELFGRAQDKPVKPSGNQNRQPQQNGQPRCPHCKKPIAPGDVFCGSCGAVLE